MPSSLAITKLYGLAKRGRRKASVGVCIVGSSTGATATCSCCTGNHYCSAGPAHDDNVCITYINGSNSSIGRNCRRLLWLQQAAVAPIRASHRCQVSVAGDVLPAGYPGNSTKWSRSCCRIWHCRSADDWYGQLRWEGTCKGRIELRHRTRSSWNIFVLLALHWLY